MYCRFCYLCLLSIAIIGLVNGDSWWQDELNSGGNPWKRENPEKQRDNIEKSADEKCKCVLEYQCDKKTGIIITDGMGIIGWRSAQKCSSKEVCCLLPEDSESNEPPGELPSSELQPGDDPSVIGNSNDNIMEDVDEGDFATVPENVDDGDFATVPEDVGGGDIPTVPENVDESVERNSEPTSTGETGATGSGSSSFFVCGVANKANVELKVSGDADETETMPGNFPWTLVLKYLLPGANANDPSAQVLLCGASLILPSVALTAAHCLDKKDPENILVRAGEWDLANDDDDILYPQERRVIKVITHPNYDLFTIKYDIAILFLDSPFQSSLTVNTICMPSSEEKVEWTTCYATGWGAKGDDALPTADQTLKKARLPLVPHDQCEKMLRKTKLGGRFKLHKSFMCAGGENDVDTCKGDGGGPLACQTNSPPYNFQLVGITSWGVGCAKREIPGVYTDVKFLSDWVATEVQQAIQSLAIPAQ